MKLYEVNKISSFLAFFFSSEDEKVLHLKILQMSKKKVFQTFFLDATQIFMYSYPKLNHATYINVLSKWKFFFPTRFMR